MEGGEEEEEGGRRGGDKRGGALYALGIVSIGLLFSFL